MTLIRKRIGLQLMAPAFVLLCSIASAADNSSWDGVRSLRPGESVGVIAHGFKQHAFTLNAATDDAISLRSESGGDVSIPRADVLRVFRPRPKHRVRNALIGLAAGVGLAFAVDQTAGRYVRNEDGGDGGRALTYIVTIGVGGLLGAALPADITIYQKSH